MFRGWLRQPDNKRNSGLALVPARGSLLTSVTNGSVYFSFALRVSELAGLESNGACLAGLNPGAGFQATTPTLAGTRVWVRPASGAYQIGLSKTSPLATEAVWAPSVFQSNNVLLVVGCYAFQPAGPGDDQAYLWINPPEASFGAGGPPTPTVSSTSGTDLARLASFVLWQRALPFQPDVAWIEELRIGTSWASVTPSGPASADLALSVTPSRVEMTEADSIDYTITVRNNGPVKATAVQLTDSLPDRLAVQSIRASQGECQVQGGRISCQRSELLPGQEIAVNLLVGLKPGLDWHGRWRPHQLVRGIGCHGHSLRDRQLELDLGRHRPRPG